MGGVAPVMEALGSLELFAGLTEAQRHAVGAIAVQRRASAGDTLFRIGERADDLYMVQRGRVELTFPLQVLGETREIRFQSLEAGRTLGWSALVPPHCLTLTARATTEVDLVVIGGGRFLALLEAQPELGRAVMANLAAVVASRFQELLALWVRQLQRDVSHTYR